MGNELERGQHLCGETGEVGNGDNMACFLGPGDALRMFFQHFSPHISWNVSLS